MELVLFSFFGTSTLICVYFYYLERNSPFLRSRYPNVALLQILSFLVYIFSRFFTMFRYVFGIRDLSNAPRWFYCFDYTLFITI